MLVGDFMLNGVTFTFRAPHESSAIRFANIFMRGFVKTGEGQLISGFVIRGGRNWSSFAHSDERWPPVACCRFSPIRLEIIPWQYVDRAKRELAECK